MLALKLNYNLFSFLRVVVLTTICLLLIFSQTIAIFAQTPASVTNTKASLVIEPTNFSIILGTFTVDPAEIFKGEELIFTLNKVTLENGTTASNLPCRITITLADASVVIIDGLTSAAGLCVYNSSLSLSSQGLTLVSGDIFKVNTVIGVGSAFATVTYNGNSYITNTDSFKVKQKSLTIGAFLITPKIINIGQSLVFSISDVKFNDGTVGANLPSILTIKTPSGNNVVISGVTDSSGKLVFDSSRSLSSQGLLIVSGNLADLNNISGSGQAFVKITYDGQVYNSNVDTYAVNAPFIPPIDIPKIVQILTRTGGGVPLGIVIILLLAAMAMLVRSSLKKDKRN
jgi:hypothetical protein